MENQNGHMGQKVRHYTSDGATNYEEASEAARKEM